MKEVEAEIFAEKFAQKFAEKLQQARSVSDSEHYDHHKWITAKIQRENAMRAFWEDMQKHVAKWGAISIITGLFYAGWLGFKQLVRVAS